MTGALGDSPAALTVVAGGALGAFIGWCAMSSPKAGTERACETTGSRALGLLESHKYVCSDSILYTTLQEPLILFYDTNEPRTRSFLKHADTLIEHFAFLRSGKRRAGEIPLVLRERREASNHLLLLLRDAKRKRPMAASEIQEDIEMIKKILDGYVHNCMQQSNLNLLEATVTSPG